LQGITRICAKPPRNLVTWLPGDLGGRCREAVARVRTHANRLIWYSLNVVLPRLKARSLPRMSALKPGISVIFNPELRGGTNLIPILPRGWTILQKPTARKYLPRSCVEKLDTKVKPAEKGQARATRKMGRKPLRCHNALSGKGERRGGAASQPSRTTRGMLDLAGGTGTRQPRHRPLVAADARRVGRPLPPK